MAQDPTKTHPRAQPEPVNLYRTESFGTRNPAKEDQLGGLAGLSVPLLLEGRASPATDPAHPQDEAFSGLSS
jgi:hypothetical protein